MVGPISWMKYDRLEAVPWLPWLSQVACRACQAAQVAVRTVEAMGATALPYLVEAMMAFPCSPLPLRLAHPALGPHVWSPEKG
jgi:hypothetical protein